MTRPKELLDRIAIERVVTQGVTPEGNASPEASPAAVKVAPGVSASPSNSNASTGQPAAPKDRPTIDGTPSRISGVMPFPGIPAAPSDKPVSVGAKADPRTGVPDVPVDVEVKSNGVSAGPISSIRDKEIQPGRPVSPVDVGQSPGRPAAPVRRDPASGPPAGPAEKTSDPGRTVSPRTQEPFKVSDPRVRTPEPFTGIAASPKSADVGGGPAAAPLRRDPASGQPAQQAEKTFDPGRNVTPRPQEPFKVGDAKVYAPETMAGRVATPKILDAIAGVPAAQREKQSYTGTAQVTPQSQVTITVPPAFPYDPKELFAVVDSLINLPPRRDPTPRRNLAIPIEQADLESTESFVARSFAENAGNTSDLDRWNL